MPEQSLIFSDYKSFTAQPGILGDQHRYVVFESTNSRGLEKKEQHDLVCEIGLTRATLGTHLFPLGGVIPGVAFHARI
jgi:hypothetical protein